MAEKRIVGGCTDLLTVSGLKPGSSDEIALVPQVAVEHDLRVNALH
jgi:hypothetical protein